MINFEINNRKGVLSTVFGLGLYLGIEEQLINDDLSNIMAFTRNKKYTREEDSAPCHE